MKAQVEVESPEAETLQEVLEPSLTSDDTVSYRVDREGDSLSIEVETDSLGPLRGATDTVFRLTMLSNKIITR
jgi:tRNA threonylcarbamoyladenosine modification (KEOPS) complex  Pcc1 subunit